MTLETQNGKGKTDHAESDQERGVKSGMADVSENTERKDTRRRDTRGRKKLNVLQENRGLCVVLTIHKSDTNKKQLRMRPKT